MVWEEVPLAASMQVVERFAYPLIRPLAQHKRACLPSQRLSLPRRASWYTHFGTPQQFSMKRRSTGPSGQRASRSRGTSTGPRLQDALAGWQDWGRDRPWLRLLVGWLAVTLAIAVWKFDVVDSPPYYDFATGLFVEATFLAESNFDYRSLVFEQQRWLAGGPAVYITSILPTLLAVLMKTLPSPRAVLMAYHLFTFGCTALVLVLLYRLLVQQTGRLGAGLTCVALVTVPLFSVQVDMLGMDMPLAVCGLVCATCLARKQYVRAAAFGGLSLLAKNTGLVLAAGVVAFVALNILLSWRGLRPHSQRWYWYGAGAIFLVIGLFMLVDEMVLALPSSELESWDNFSHDITSGIVFQRQILSWCPDQLVVFSVAAVGSAIAAGRWLVRSWPQRRGANAYDQLTNLLHDGMLVQPVAVFGWIIVLGMLSAFVMIYSIPRYFILPLPFLYFILGLVLFHRPQFRRGASIGLACLIAFNLLNASGRFLPELDSEGRTGAHLERSREYLVDHRSNIEAMRQLASLDPPPQVIAGSPYVHYLGLPSLGCVDRPLTGYSVNTFVPPTFQSATKLVDDAPLEIVFVSVHNALIPPGLIPPPSEGDKVLYDDQQEHSLIVYRRDWPRHLRREDIAAWYRRMLRPQQTLAAQAASLAQDGRLDEAWELYERVLTEKPEDVEALIGSGQLMASQGNWEGALQRIKRGARLATADVGVQYYYAAILFELARFDEAETQIDATLEIDPSYAPAHHLRGLALANQARWTEAVESLALAARHDPLNADYQRDWGRVACLAGNPQIGVQRLRRALQLRPHWNLAANDLAWILATHPDDAVRNGVEAVRLSERTQQSPENTPEMLPGLLDTLAAAQAEAGRFDEAVATARRAAEQARELGQTELASDIDQRAALYRAQNPYRDTVASHGAKTTP